MRLVDLIDRVATVNAASLAHHGIDLHRQNLKVTAIEALDPGHHTDRNTCITLYANTKEVLGSQQYFYNRTDISNLLWTANHSPSVTLADIQEVGLTQALLNLDDSKINVTLLTEIHEYLPETNLSIHYAAGVSEDLNAFVKIDCLGYFGQCPVHLIIDEHNPVRLDEILLGGDLDGFDQD